MTAVVVSSAYWERYGRPAPPVATIAHRGLTGFDLALICLFMVGLYTNYTIPVSDKLPFPSAPAGLAGAIMLWRHRQSLGGKSFAGLILVLLLYVARSWSRRTSRSCRGASTASSSSPIRS